MPKLKSTQYIAKNTLIAKNRSRIDYNFITGVIIINLRKVVCVSTFLGREIK
jgi:hypothetical protein